MTPPKTNSGSLRVAWQGITLRQAVDHVQRDCEASVFVDRRVDHSQTINLQAEGDAQQLLGAIAEKAELGFTAIAGSFYLGPREAARDLLTLHARGLLAVSKLPQESRQAFSQSKRIAWQRLTDPRDLISEVASSLGLSISNPELLPHDLWQEGKLPSARRSEQLTLLLVGFGLEWHPLASGDRIALAPITSPATLTSLHSSRGGSTLTADEFLKMAPSTNVRVRGDVWALRGRLEDHLLLEKAFREGSTNKTSSPTTRNLAKPDATLINQRFTLTVKQQPAGAVLQQIAAALSLEVSNLSGVDFAQQQISFQVEQATLEELLDAISQEVGAAIRFENGRIAIQQAL